jgi:hypothetical protein
MIDPQEVIVILNDCAPYIENGSLMSVDAIRLENKIQIKVGENFAIYFEEYVVKTHKQRIERILERLPHSAISRNGTKRWATLNAAMHAEDNKRWTNNFALAKGLLALGIAIGKVSIGGQNAVNREPVFTVKG